MERDRGIGMHRHAGHLAGRGIHAARHIKRDDWKPRVEHGRDRVLDGARRCTRGSRAEQCVDYEVCIREEISHLAVWSFNELNALSERIGQCRSRIAGSRSRCDLHHTGLSPVQKEEPGDLEPVTSVIARATDDHDAPRGGKAPADHAFSGGGRRPHQIDAGDAKVADRVRIDGARAGGVVERRLSGGTTHTCSLPLPI